MPMLLTSNRDTRIYVDIFASAPPLHIHTQNNLLSQFIPHRLTATAKST